MNRLGYLWKLVFQPAFQGRTINAFGKYSLSVYYVPNNINLEGYKYVCQSTYPQETYEVITDGYNFRLKWKKYLQNIFQLSLGIFVAFGIGKYVIIKLTFDSKISPEKK